MLSILKLNERFNILLLSYYFTVFGLGTLIFTGLEIAMHATMETNCVEDIVIAHPILQALFTFLQMHFLFVNSQVNNQILYNLIKFENFSFIQKDKNDIQVYQIL